MSRDRADFMSRLPAREDSGPDPDYDHDVTLDQIERLSKLFTFDDARTQSRRHGHHPSREADVRRFLEHSALGTRARDFASHERLTIRAIQKSIARGRALVRERFQSPDLPSFGTARPTTKNEPKW